MGICSPPKMENQIDKAMKMIWKLGLYSGRYRESGFQQSGILSKESTVFWVFDVESPCL